MIVFDNEAVNEIVEKHVKMCEKVYENTSAGDYTWHGILYNMVRELVEADIPTKNHSMHPFQTIRGG